jgi:organic hydroperoxide reductase OsmC/OhrA
MQMSAHVSSQSGQHTVQLSTDGSQKVISIPAKTSGIGSSANGAELLMLALATCYCNDILREAGKRGIQVTRVEVQASGDFFRDGEPLHNIRYRTAVHAEAPDDQILELMRRTDTVAEIQNTLRSASTVTLEHCVANASL